MNRRGFDDTLRALKSHLLDQAGRFLDDTKMPFDRVSYEKQASIDLDDVTKELIFFGSNIFPVDGATGVEERRMSAG